MNEVKSQTAETKSRINILISFHIFLLKFDNLNQKFKKVNFVLKHLIMSSVLISVSAKRIYHLFISIKCYLD